MADVTCAGDAGDNRRAEAPATPWRQALRGTRHASVPIACFLHCILSAHGALGRAARAPGAGGGTFAAQRGSPGAARGAYLSCWAAITPHATAWLVSPSFERHKVPGEIGKPNSSPRCRNHTPPGGLQPAGRGSAGEVLTVLLPPFPPPPLPLLPLTACSPPANQHSAPHAATHACVQGPGPSSACDTRSRHS